MKELSKAHDRLMLEIEVKISVYERLVKSHTYAIDMLKLQRDFNKNVEEDQDNES